MSHLMSRVLNDQVVQSLVTSWFIEDQPAFDIQSLAWDSDGDTVAEAVLWCKSTQAVLAGYPFVESILSRVSCQIKWLLKEGQQTGESPLRVASVYGKAHCVLKAERILLNVISRCSGVATLTSQVMGRIRETGWRGILAGTRKTTPGFRIPEKYSLLIGGASTHRHDLSSMIMIKDNHIRIAGGVENAIKRVKSFADFSSKIEVEVRNLEEGMQALNAGVEIIMLDNFNPQDLQKVSKELKEKDPRILIEASGGITPDNIHNYCLPHVDIISMSCLVQGYPTIDFSLKIV